MLKRVMLFWVVMATLVSLKGQVEVDFKHKSMVKAMQKVGIEDLSWLKEMDLPDSLLHRYAIKGKYYCVEKDNVSNCDYIYVGRVNSCRAGGCSVSREASLEEGGSEYFDYFVFFDADRKVTLVKVFNYQATHGHEVTTKGWLKQFVGHDSSKNLRVDKEVDSISGATISVYAITQDVREKTELLMKL